MGLPVVVMAKLIAIAPNHGVMMKPLVTSLLWPFLLKFLLSFDQVQEVCEDIAHKLHHLYFQVRLIVSTEGTATEDEATVAVRWHRAVRLVVQRINQTREARPTPTDHENMHALSIITL